MTTSREAYASPPVLQWASNASTSVFLCWEDDWSAGVASLVTGEAHPWNLPDGLAADDVLVTVLACDPALVVSVERVLSVNREIGFEQQILRRPVPWKRLLQGISPMPEPASQLLSDGAAVLAALSGSASTGVDDEKVSYDCRRRSPSGLTVAAILAAGHGIACDACEEPVHAADAEAHYTGHATLSALHEGVESTILLCQPCHTLLHDPSVEGLKRRMRPACPRCGLRDYVSPIMWGLPAGPPAVEDDIVLGGCVVTESAAQWHCRDCGVDIRVATGSANPALDAPSIHATTRRRDRNIRSLGDLARALGARATVEDVQEELFGMSAASTSRT